MGRHPGEGRRGARMLAVVPSGGTMRAVLVTALVCVASGQYGNNNPVIIHNRLSGGPGHLSLGGRAAPPDPCNPNPCGPGARCSQNSQGNAICQCEPGLIPKPDTITGCGPECITDPDCGRGLVCQNQRCVEEPDPCQPNPCGPGALCSVTGNGNAICRCAPGLIPKPDTITGCGPECVRDPDCAQGLVCQDQQCVPRPDPCDPSPCGPGAVCQLTGSGNAICRCSPGLIPNPDTITGCKPECIRDPDCQQGFICTNQKCVEKPDPCDPSPCGPGASCTVNFNGNSICRCNPGLIPKPDTITGCGPECVRDPDCRTGYICQSQRCVEKPDPCDPSPCGPNTECSVTPSGNPICRCLPNYIPQPDTITGCGRECERDPDCQSGYICQNYRCVVKPDPCDPSPCGPNTECNVNRQGNPVCTCVAGFIPQPDTITGCIPAPRTPPPDPCDPSPCGPNTRCDVNRAGNPVCKCLPGFVPMPDSIQGCTEKPRPCENNGPCGTNAECRENGDTATCVCPAGFQGDPYSFCKQGECEHDHECAHTLACFDYHCKDPCIGTCGQGAVCKVQDHRPVCSCPSGFTGDPLAACKRRIVVGARKKPVPVQEPRNIIVIGQQYTPDGGSREVQQQIQGRNSPRGRTRGVAVIGSTRKRRFLNLIKALSREE